MNEFPVTSWHVSRTIDVPIETAAATFDRLVAAGDASPDGTLSLAPAAVSISYTPFPGAPRRSMRGLLRTRRARRGVPVEVELTAWSAQRSEIGLRPARRLPRGAAAAAYFAAAVTGIEELTAKLAATAHVRTIMGDQVERAS